MFRPHLAESGSRDCDRSRCFRRRGLQPGIPGLVLGRDASSIDLFTRLGAPIPSVTAYIVRACELVGGTLVLFGLGVRWLGIWFIFQFLYSFSMVKMPHLGWDESRIDFMMLAGALMLFVAGAGAPSLDAWLERRRAVSPEHARDRLTLP